MRLVAYSLILGLLASLVVLPAPPDEVMVPVHSTVTATVTVTVTATPKPTPFRGLGFPMMRVVEMQTDGKYCCKRVVVEYTGASGETWRTSERVCDCPEVHYP